MKRMLLVMSAVIACFLLAGWAMLRPVDESEAPPRMGLQEAIVHRTNLSSGGSIVYIHDERREVGIWLFIGGFKAGMAVLPDSEYLEIEEAKIE